MVSVRVCVCLRECACVHTLVFQRILWSDMYERDSVSVVA